MTDTQQIVNKAWSSRTGRLPGMLGEIFKKARQEIQNPATLKRLIVDLIDPEQWMTMEAVVTWSAENPAGRWRRLAYEELSRRDELNLDLFWLKDESLQDAEDLPEPDGIAREIVEDLQAALEEFQAIAGELEGE
jgi:hypothetical protein